MKAVAPTGKGSYKQAHYESSRRGETGSDIFPYCGSKLANSLSEAR